jgi:peroxiredoxin
MAAGLLAGRLFLAAVFALAGLAKLSDRAGWRRAVGDFGVPARFLAPVALLVPLAEFATSGALLPAASARWGALGALALLGALSAAVAVQLARGRRPDCRCFGRLHSAPVGRSSLVRNGVLAAVAGLVAWGGWHDAGRRVTDGLGGLSPPSWWSASTAVVVLAGLGLQGWLILNLLRQNGRILLRLDTLDAGRVTGPGGGTTSPPAPAAGLGERHATPAPPPAAAGNGRHAQDGSPASRPLAVGEPAPDLALPDLQGRIVDLNRGHDHPVLLLFWSPDCGFCQQLLDAVKAWERERRPDGRRLLVVSTGSAEANQALGLRSPVLLDPGRRVMRAFGAHGTPMAVLIDATGAIVSPLAAGVAQVRALAGADARQPVTTTVDARSDHRDGRA